MIKAATKAEVVQVAHDLLDPLMEDVHRDVENLRAQLTVSERTNEKLRKDLDASRKRFDLQMKRHAGMLETVLARLAQLENRP